MADSAAIAACVRAAYAKYLAYMAREPAPLRVDYATLIAEGVVYTLVADGDVRGVLVMMPRAGDLFVENVAVDPAFQERGFGRRLMAFAERAARVDSLGTIRLYTNEVMTENLEYYRRLGFVEEARRMEDGYSRVFLRKDLALA
jgi:ribosomal protein S18 acetylase RimI-like enzyme